MYQKITVLVLLFCCIATSASAHVMNRNNVYSDLSLTEAADDIVLLAALHVIQSDYKQFEPTELLTMNDLAKWVAGYYGLADEQAAIDAGFVTTIEGHATYEAVNAAYFNNALTLQAEQTGPLTREAFAQFVAAHVNSFVDGQTMLDAAGFTAGPVGEIEAVDVIDGVYVLIVNHAAYTLGNHPSAIADSADPTVWVGQTISESYIGPNVARDYAKASDETALQFVVIGHEAYTVAPPSTTIEDVTIEQALQQVAVVEQVKDDTQDTNFSMIWLYVGVLLLLVLSGIGVGKHKRLAQKR